MQAFIVLKDSFGGEVRLPVNVSIPVPDAPPVPKQETKPEPDLKPFPDTGHRVLRKYPPEYRAQAVQAALDLGTTRASKVLGVPLSTIDAWLLKYRKALVQPKAPTMTGVTAWSMS